MSLSVSIKKSFKDFNLDVNFETGGEYLGILGASGSGKSMTLKCIAGIETPDEGQIILNGRVLFDSEKKINIRPQDRNVGYLFQNYALFPNMTVGENIGAGMKLPKSEKSIRISEIVKTFHLDGMEYKYPLQLSGGQQQRVALARIFAYEPDVLMLDEPFSAMDTHLKEKLQSEIFEYLRLYKGEVLMVTHNRSEVYRFCKNLVIIDNGKSVLLGDMKETFRQPGVMSAARLTGCKNISKCRVLSAHSIYAQDWGITLETEREIDEDINYVGIRAHNFKLSDSKEGKNTFVCKINKVVEELFEYTIIMKVKNQNGQCKPENSEIWFKIKKAEWDNRYNRENLYIRIPEDAILMLK